MSREHQTVPGGFECPLCGATRQTPLGMSRHRTHCTGDDQ
jgi:hypothetical protein